MKNQTIELPLASNDKTRRIAKTSFTQKNGATVSIKEDTYFTGDYLPCADFHADTLETAVYLANCFLKAWRLKLAINAKEKLSARKYNSNEF
jgi:O-succinylbenzoate synthase